MDEWLMILPEKKHKILMELIKNIISPTTHKTKIINMVQMWVYMSNIG